MDDQKFYTVTDCDNNTISLNAVALRSLADVYFRLADADQYRVDILSMSIKSRLSKQQLQAAVQEIKELTREITRLRNAATSYYIITM